MKNISVYIKTGRHAATSYYRFYQFFDFIGANFEYNLMIPEEKKEHFLPISKQPKWKQIVIFFYIYIRTLYHLLKDLIRRPPIIIISRCLINRVLPLSYQLIIVLLKIRGAILIWDFDDNIICTREVTRSGFDFLSKYASMIFVGSPELTNIIKEEYRGKVKFVPTTDGDMYRIYSSELQKLRLDTFGKIVKMVWVGTFVGLQYVKRIIPAFEQLGKYLNSQGRQLDVSIVCDYPLDYQAKNFVLYNIKWQRDIAIDQIFHAHIGIMPLEDNENTRGKCGFKLIQYLSASLPVVGSGVGMNRLIITNKCGYCVKELDVSEWFEAFKGIVTDMSSWKRFSEGALIEWETKFSYKRNLETWKKFLME